ncbi:hypothetical protein BGW41_002305 [Actinomortierella wolfii]|nr:hypothetical protein BGW41_002305 [Actinomortierella wolfii]
MDDESSNGDTSMGIDDVVVGSAGRTFQLVEINDAPVDDEKTLQLLRIKVERLQAEIIQVGSTFAMNETEEEERALEQQHASLRLQERTVRSVLNATGAAIVESSASSDNTHSNITDAAKAGSNTLRTGRPFPRFKTGNQPMEFLNNLQRRVVAKEGQAYLDKFAHRFFGSSVDDRCQCKLVRSSIG